MISHNKPSAGHNQNINSAIPFIASLAPPDHQPLRFCPLGFACYGATSCRREVARVPQLVCFISSDGLTHFLLFWWIYRRSDMLLFFLSLYIEEFSLIQESPRKKYETNNSKANSKNQPYCSKNAKLLRVFWFVK